MGALRAGFDAVEKASAQLDDLQKLIEEEDWNSVRQFSRLYNNSVEREGMEVVARKLQDKITRKEALAVCRQVTESLKSVDGFAGKRNKDNALASLQKARDTVASFQKFKP